MDGILSKSCAGGGEGRDHSRVQPSQGFGPEGGPLLWLRKMFTKRSTWAPPKMKPPKVAREFSDPHPVSGAYVCILRGISSKRNIGKKIMLNPMKETIKWILATVSLYILPVIFG